MVEQLHKTHKAQSPSPSLAASSPSSFASTLRSKTLLQFWAPSPGNCIESRSKKKEKARTGIPSSSTDNFLEVPDNTSFSLLVANKTGNSFYFGVWMPN